MSRNRLIQIIAIAGVLLCAVVGAALNEKIEHRRAALQLGPSVKLAADTPPYIVIGTAATGPFRGLFVDMLWYRADRLKQEGKYFESNELARWITRLQPRFSKVWAFHAWNLAYNISVATNTPEERWDWVNKGINLLRDEGIPQNPKAIGLYRELGWIFFHKIGEFSDDMHWVYKRRLAHEWQEVMGAPDEGATAQQRIDAFRQIVTAPDSLAALVAQRPGVYNLLDRKLAPLHYEPNERLLRQIGRVAMFRVSDDARRLGVKEEARSRFYDVALAKVIQDPADADDVAALVAFLRKQVLRQTYHMDPAFMLDVMDYRGGDDVGFGPLDWRHPDAHALYWSALGVQRAMESVNQKNIDFINTDRQVVHSLQALTRFGRLYYDPVTDRLDMLPDTDFIPAYDRAFESAIRMVKSGKYGLGSAETFYTGHENFLLMAIAYEYTYGDMKRAQFYFDKAANLYGTGHRGQTEHLYEKPLDELVTNWWRQNMEMMASTRQFVDAMVFQAFTRGVANNRRDVFDRMINLARLAWLKFQQESVPTPTSDQRRMALLAFDELVANSFARMLKDPRLPLLLRSRVWDRSPDSIRQRVYDSIRETVRQAAARENFDPDRAFAEPPGMDAYRKQHAGDDSAAPSEPAKPNTVERK